MNFIEEIRRFVEAECKKPTSKYGLDPYFYHFVPTAEYAELLADEIGGDKEIILISAWLHDIGSIIHGRENHHITGAEIAEKKLLELNYPKNKIEIVKKCILNHRGSIKNSQTKIEEKIVSDADAMANFENIAGIMKAALVYENKTQGEANKIVNEKLTKKYNKLNFEKSKQIIKPKYDAVMVLF